MIHRLVTIDPAEIIEATSTLTAAQSGVFFKLLCHQWVTGLHVTSTRELARLAGTSPQHVGKSRKKLEPLLERDFKMR
jgi:uncharacterized protein YdaU (DUF1376 family)